MNKKAELINFMNSLDFGIADIKFENGHEWYAHKMIDSDELVWFPIESGGSGFQQLFQGAIMKACKGNKVKDYERHIRNTCKDKEHFSICGEIIYDFVFQDVDHCFWNIVNGGTPQPCQKCLGIVIDAFTGGFIENDH